jgi:hypothetical protein
MLNVCASIGVICIVTADDSEHGVMILAFALSASLHPIELKGRKQGEL